ncbi:hypothetical protein BDQ17DRAFT_1322452 [Cyathus striatus]|nr:hypothetical protein BDQ17DRAFT_1322452 [Cyathus striatus]
MLHLSSSNPPLKRKLDNDAPPASAKKQKHASASTPVLNGTTLKFKPPKSSASATPQLTPMANASDDYPHGFIYCHQCCKKRDVRDSLHCTYLLRYTTTKDKRTREKRCINKFCRACLKNRYGEDLDYIRATTNGKRKDADHVEGAGYIFTCPRCRDMCNCPKCRKIKGLEPIGSLTTKKTPEEQESAKAKSGKAKAQPASSKSKSKPKPLPLIHWTSLYSSLTQEEAEDRFLIREFLLRFAPIMDPPPTKAALEELENVAGRKKNRDEDREMEDWVSEMCAKCVIMGLLGLVADASPKNIQQHIEVALKELKGVGVNLSRIWSILATLREALINPAGTSSSSSSKFELELSFPDPLPPPVVTMAYNTRHKQNGQEGVLHVTHTAQLIPIITSLIKSVTDTEVIRDEIERGVKEGKDAVRDAREGMKKENDRWELVRKTLEDASKDRSVAPINKLKRETHKLQLLNFENALKVLMPGFAPRFQPLGRDTEGRVYYALTPGVGEREAALEFLVNSLMDPKQKAKTKKKDRVLSPEERSEMREWSWFLAVWGCKPEEARINGHVNGSGRSHTNVDHEDSEDDEDGEDQEEEDEDAEQWWGFWEPGEIHKVAEWIRIKGGLEDAGEENTTTTNGTKRKSFKQTPASVMAASDTPSEEQLKELVKSLEDYASSLEWRMREDKYGAMELAKAQAVAAEKAEAQAKRKSTGGSVSANGR